MESRFVTQEWTSERTAALIALWNEGISASEIGRRLGITKNAAIGKAFRLQLEKRRPTVAAEPEPETHSVIRLDRLGAGMCSWPLAGAEGVHFCGAATSPGKPYCPSHCKLAYVPVNRRKTAAVA